MGDRIDLAGDKEPVSLLSFYVSIRLKRASEGNLRSCFFIKVIDTMKYILWIICVYIYIYIYKMKDMKRKSKTDEKILSQKIIGTYDFNKQEQA